MTERLLFAAWLLLHSCSPMAQPGDPPPIGSVDFYGLRTITETEARKVLPFQVGDPIPEESANALSTAMAAALGVSRVEFNFVCCTSAGLFQLYVGVEEPAGGMDPYVTAPDGAVRLPAEIVADFEAFLQRLMEAVLDGNAREDHAQGHALAASEPVRRIQETFLAHAAQYHDRLLQVLHQSADPRHRAIAAHVLGYSTDKAAICGDLQRAVLDPDEDVRNYATRSLAVIAEYAVANPELGIEIRPGPFIAMLDSFVWSDGNKGLAVLASLTAGREPRLLDELRRRSLPSLLEMCGWQHWGHAAPACLILQRITGLPDDPDVQSRHPTLERARQQAGDRSLPGVAATGPGDNADAGVRQAS